MCRCGASFGSTFLFENGASVDGASVVYENKIAKPYSKQTETWQLDAQQGMTRGREKLEVMGKQIESHFARAMWFKQALS